MARKLSKSEESRLRGLAAGVETQAEGKIVQQTIRFSWVRRRVVEKSYLGPGGEVKSLGDTFDIWLEEPPGEPPREPDRRAYSSHATAKELLKYELYVRTF